MFLRCISHMSCNFFRLKMDYEIHENSHQNSFLKILEDVSAADPNIFTVVTPWWQAHKNLPAPKLRIFSNLLFHMLKALIDKVVFPSSLVSLSTYWYPFILLRNNTRLWWLVQECIRDRALLGLLSWPL